MAQKVKVLVLGATGIIGRELCAVLVGRGYDVYAVSRGSRRPTKDVTTIVADVRNTEVFAAAVEGFVFHTVVDLVSFDAVQSAAVLEAISGKCKQYMFVSSATVYDSAKKGLISESSSRLTKGWRYPLKKIDAEKSVMSECAKRGIAFTIVRPYITYSEQRISFGEWEGVSVIERIKDGRPIVLGDELANTVTTLTHSYDLSVGMAGLVGNESAYNEDFHITSDEYMTWRQVFEVAGNVIGKKPNIIDMGIDKVASSFPEIRGKIEDRCLVRKFDNSKIKKAVPGFKCKYSLEDGYRQVIGGILGKDSAPSDLVTQAKIDRLARKYASVSGLKAIDSYRKSLRGKDWARYQIGYYSWVYGFARFVRNTVRRGKKQGDYALE